MLGSKRRKRRKQQQVIDSLGSIEAEIFRRVLFIIQERGLETSRHLPRAVVNRLLGKPYFQNGDDPGVATQIARVLVARDEQIRDAVFISLQASLAVAGENKHFAEERRILEAIQWLKEFGEIPQTSHDSETLKAWVVKLETSIESVAA